MASAAAWRQHGGSGVWLAGVVAKRLKAA